MAIAALPTVFKSFTFGGESSADYGVQILGEGVFNAPERAVELVSVPGRNGSIAIDQGYWENIEVTYPAVLIARNPEEFATAMANFRNMLCSKRGYCRLSDDYHPGEYRMAMFNNDIEVDEKVLRGGEFDITFNCKPQRWLTEGEEPVTIGEWGATKTASGEIVTIESEGGEAAKSLEVSLSPIQAGSGEPSPTNIRPISGRTEVVTQRTGKNLAEMVADGMTPSLSNGNLVSYPQSTHSQYIKVNPSASYTASFGNTLLNGVFQYDANKNFVRADQASTVTTKTITTANNTAYIMLRCDRTAKTDPIPLCQLEEGTEATDYEPYQGNTYTTALGRTVYGGTLDVVSGVLTVDRAMVDLGSLTWTYSSGYSETGRAVYYATLTGCKSYTNSQVAGCIAERYETASVNNVLTTAGCIGIGASSRVWASTTAQGTTPTGSLVYELATPQTYQLTPQQISLLVGENNLWSDGAITMQYGDDPNSLWNPTLYDSSPLLMVEGYGNIDLGENQRIQVQNMTLGEITYIEPTSSTAWNFEVSTNPNDGRILSGDALNIGKLTTVITMSLDSDAPYTFVSSGTGATFTKNELNASETHSVSSYKATVAINVPPQTMPFTFAVGASTVIQFTLATTSAPITVTWTFIEQLYGTTTFRVTANCPVSGESGITTTYSHSFGGLTAESSISTLGHPTYVDLEIGEAYKYEDDVLVSVNNGVSLPASLPVLKPGETEITTDDTITDLTIIPRWWQL